MQKIGIVLASSERCWSLVEHFLLTFNSNVLPHITTKDIQITSHIYKCNFNIIDINQFGASRTTRNVPVNSFSYSSFKSNPSLHNFNLKFDTFIEDCSTNDFKYKSFYLPDIAVYQDFYDKHFRDYDYLMFCHNDVAFYNPTDMIDKMLFLLNGTQYNIVCNCSANFNNDLSLRFHPAMIFIKSSTMQICNLSFINDLDLFNTEFRIFPDGGAGLLASYYHQNNKGILRVNKPYSDLPSSWFTHLRALGDTGVEFCYHYFKENIEFQRVMNYVKQYNDQILFST
jgi:hypothetical protein